MTAARLRRLRTRAGDEPQDAGFSLMEVVVALFTLTFVSIATASFFISAVRTTADQSRSQTALALATRSLEAVQALPVSTVLSGRTQTAVQALVTDPAIVTLVAQDVVATDNFDASATAASSPQVPIRSTQVLKGTTYTISTAIDRCWLSNSAHACARVAATDAVSVLRATVNVSWGTCGTRCSYSTSALLDAQADPLFNIAMSQPIIVTTTPTSTVTGTSVPVTLTGVALANGATITTGTGGGTFTSVLPVGTTGKKTTATWNPGTVPGNYTIALVNPDGGRAEFSSMTVLPDANDDCVSVVAALSTINVRANDVPSTTGGTVAIASLPSAGIATVSADRGSLIYQALAFGTFTLTYTLTFNGVVSPPATLTVRVGTGACP